MTGCPHHAATLLVIEIDRWRLIHDVLGPDAADIVARHVARCIEASLRPCDRCSRTSPGQFVVELDGAGHAQGERVAAQVCREIETKSFAGLGPATVSGAVAQRYPGEPVGLWWKRLDSALVQARAGGGNRVVVDRRSSDDGPEPAPGLHLEWQPRFECGEPVIDRQHRELFARAEDVLDAARREGPQVTRHVDELVREIECHFTTEEAILEQRGYRELERHRQAHRGLAEKARRMRAAAEAGRMLRDDLLRFLLGEMVADHMLAEDRLFAGLFASPRL